MTKHLVLPIALALGLGLGPLAAEEPRMPPVVGQGHRPERKPVSLAQRMERMTEHLNLSPDQQARIKAIHEKHEAVQKGHQEAAREARKAFHKAAGDLETPTDQLRKLHEAMSAKAFEVMAAGRALRLETRQILTPAQREKAAETHGRMKERMRPKHERRAIVPKG